LIADRLVERHGLGELLGAEVEQADMRIGELHDLADHLQDQSLHAMRVRVLRAEVHGVVADFIARIGRVAREGAAGWNGAGLNRAHRAAPAGPIPLSILRSWSSPRAVA